MGCSYSTEEGFSVASPSRIHPDPSGAANSYAPSKSHRSKGATTVNATSPSAEAESLKARIAFVNAQRLKQEQQLRREVEAEAAERARVEIDRAKQLLYEAQQRQSNSIDTNSIMRATERSGHVRTPSYSIQLTPVRTPNHTTLNIVTDAHRRVTGTHSQLSPMSIHDYSPSHSHSSRHRHSQQMFLYSQTSNSTLTGPMIKPQPLTLSPVTGPNAVANNNGKVSVMRPVSPHQQQLQPMSPGSASTSRRTTRMMGYSSSQPSQSPSSRFEISDTQLGKGRFARVVLGTDKQFDRKVAIKIIDKRELNRNRVMVDSELAILKRMGQHAHIVSLIDFFEDERQFYFVMDLASGGDLFSAIVERGRFSEQQAIRACKQIAEALLYIHSCGITHRDLKPENILLVAPNIDSNLKLADFGLSKLMVNDAMMGTVCGTWAYCAPEVIKHQAYTQTVDLWTLGVLMYILLCGYHPFDCYGDMPEPELLQRICDCHYDFDDPAWVNVSQPAKTLITKLLQLEPTRRLTLRDYLASEWIVGDSGSGQSVPAKEGDDTLVARRLKQWTGKQFRVIVTAKVAVQRFRASISRSQQQTPKQGTRTAASAAPELERRSTLSENRPSGAMLEDTPHHHELQGFQFDETNEENFNEDVAVYNL